MNAKPSPRLAAVLLLFAQGATALVILLAGAALVGWVFSIEYLKTLFHPRFVAMNPVTAMSLILAACSLALLMREPPRGSRRRKISIACASAVLAISILKFLSYRYPFQIDGMIFQDQLAGNSIAPNTALALGTFSLSMLLLDYRTRRGHRPSVPLALLTAAIAMLAITGYLYGVTSFYSVKGYIAMAPNTATAFLLLALANLAARPEVEPIATILSDSAGGVVARRLLPAAAILPLLVGWLCLLGVRFHLFQRPFGLTLYSLITTVIFMVLTWWNARFLLKLDVERRQAERKAAEEHHLLRSLIDNIPDVVFVKDLQHRFLLNNVAHARELGAASPEEMIGKTDADYFPPDISARMRSEEVQVTQTDVPLVDREEQLILSRGRKEILSVTKAPFHDTSGKVVGIVGIAHKITRRKQAEDERDRFFTMSVDMIAVAGFDGYFKRVNPAFETILGYTPDEVMSRPWIDFVHPDDREVTINEGKKLALGAVTLYFENRYRCKDGTYRWLSWTAVPVVREQLIYAVARDTTERRRVEEQLRDANRRLEEAISAERAAQQSLRSAQSTMVQTEKMVALGQMVAGVAHEINNPLSFVSNNVAVLQRDLRSLLRLIELYSQSLPLLEREMPQLLEQIRELSQQMDLAYSQSNLPELLTRSREGLKRIDQIVKDLRNFARLDESDLAEVNLNDGVRSTITIIQGHAKKKGVRIVSELQDIPKVYCYPAKVNQVVMNLLSNAIDASGPQGQVTVRTCSNGDRMVHIEVSDTGHGIPPDVRQRIFDPFFTTKPLGQGTGLGLSISYGIIRDHKGTIEVQSEVGKGTTFTVKLPIEGPRATG